MTEVHNPHDLDEKDQSKFAEINELFGQVSAAIQPSAETVKPNISSEEAAHGVTRIHEHDEQQDIQAAKAVGGSMRGPGVNPEELIATGLRVLPKQEDKPNIVELFSNKISQIYEQNFGTYKYIYPEDASNVERIREKRESEKERKKAA